ncbi:MAG: hypothetical protein JO035_17460 [Betaproteobacteria bacterium]|nr:hypothetical protein [Betaproteobacteria bacterium]
MKKSWLLRSGVILLTACVLAAVLLVAPFFIPLERFVPRLASLASEKLGQPVSISSLRLQLLPTPRAVAGGIEIGKRKEVAIGELEIVPALAPLFRGDVVVRLVEARDVHLKEAALAIPDKLPKGGGGDGVRVERLRLARVKLEHRSIRMPEFDLEAELAPDLSVELARLQTTDGALQVTLDPQAGGSSAVEIHAKQWTLPAGPPVRFDALSAEGSLKGEAIDLRKIEGRLYGGTLSGTARADWSRLWQVSGNSSVDGVDVVPVQKLLGKKPQISGRLKSHASFSARARTPDALVDALVLDGPFEVLGGAYQGYDLSKIGLKKLEAGGSTRFDELKGKVAVRGGEIKVTELCVRSPALVAGGNVTVSAEDKLSGKLDLSIAKTAGFVGFPVALGGTTSDPSFMPTKGYLIGAAVGTVLLPGIGTSIGSSVGTRIEGKSDCK